MPALPSTKAVFYRSIGPKLSWFDCDVDGAALTERASVMLPANVQYVWPHPSGRYLYVVSSDGGSGNSAHRGSVHRANAFTIEAASGALVPHGPERTLPFRPIHASVDRKGQYLLTAYNNPSQVTVHRIAADGTLGEAVMQPASLDVGVFAHQIMTTPGNARTILVARGNNAIAGHAEDPGALKVFSLADDGVLGNAGSVAPHGGFGFGPRHLDFHPAKPWVFVSVERQSELHVYGLADDGDLTSEPLFVRSSLEDVRNQGDPQMAGAIHVHPNGRFVYQTNRNSATTDVGGRPVVAGGENNVAVFAIDQATGEPTRIQNAEAHANHLRTFSIEPRGTLLIAASIRPIDTRGTNGIETIPAALVVYRIGDAGRLTFARKYDVDPGDASQWWCGFVTPP